eukprot:4557448-Alexandrium_andersonii.AAC.1
MAWAASGARKSQGAYSISCRFRDVGPMYRVVLAGCWLAQAPTPVTCGGALCGAGPHAGGKRSG